VAASPAPEAVQLFPELDPLIVKLLWNRGLRDQQSVDEFLLPDYGQDIHDPFLFRDMERACARVWRALADGEKIVVFGDYDADGVTGSAVLISTLRALALRLGKDAALIGSYIPHREHEGYGLRAAAVSSLADGGMKLLITVDCGIGSAAEIALAKERGIDAIVVDHHHVPEKIPEAVILHPLAPGENYPFKSLAAVGVAFKFASGLIAYAERQGAGLEPGFQKWLLDLVAIATVTDFMPLIGENRTLEKYGLIVLNKTRRPGLRRLIEIAGLKSGQIDTVSVGYQIGPRLNAASRMEHGSLALETLLAENAERADELAGRLQQLNADRQKVTETIVRAARITVGEQSGRKLQIVSGDGWPAGVVGLIAGKLAGENGLPVFIFGKEGERYVGSGRGIPGFDLMACLDRCKPYLSRYGGHTQACGVTIEGEDNYRAFCEAAEAYAREALAGRDLRPALDIDAVLGLGQITWDLLDWLAKFEPFGEGNQRPKFLLRDLLVTSLYPVGKDGKHVRIGVRGDSAREMKMIGFNLAPQASGLLPGSVIDAVVELGVNVWNGSRSIQLKVLDWRPVGVEESKV